MLENLTHKAPKIAYYLMAFMCVLELVVGALVTFSDVPALKAAGFGVYNLFFGVIFAVLLGIGFKKKLFTPLTLGLFLFLVDMGFLINQMIVLDLFMPAPFIVRVLFFIPWFNGCVAAYRTRRMQRAAL